MGRFRKDAGMVMTSFPSSLMSVFGGGAAVQPPSVASRPKPWPIFKLVTPVRTEPPPAELARMVESEIIPRLMLAHSSARPDVAEPANDPVTPLGFASARACVRMVLSRDPEALTSAVQALLGRGVSTDTIYVDLLAPAAHMLAELWDQDQVSFTEVTIGLGRLQQLLRGLDLSTPYNGDNDPSARSALFAPRPGEQQTFGFYIIEEQFRWSGWRSWIETATTNDALAANVRCRWFDMLCLSVSRAADIEDVAVTIAAIRRASRNQALLILVNGNPFVDHPELVTAVGADAAASSSQEALKVADEAVSRLANE